MAEQLKNRFKVGQRVRFRRSHDKTTELTGTIAGLDPGDDDCVSIQTEVDGRKVEVSGIETAHAGDVTPIDSDGAAVVKKSATAAAGARRIG